MSANCAAWLLVPASITGINIEDDQGGHICLIDSDAEDRMVAWHETLNRMPVKGLTSISARQASVQTPPPLTRGISPSRTLFIPPYASHRRWRF
ncbi:TPA: DUF905 family protein [Enterobacter mori]|nr:DUF905 family protein [Enterobacter mori]